VASTLFIALPISVSSKHIIARSSNSI
jgi:hypothetical protein